MSLILPSTQLVAELTALGWKRVIGVMDRQVLCPEERWVEKFSKWIAAKAPRYRGEVFDCDDFARWAVVEATKSRVRNSQEDPCGHSFLFCIVRIGMLEVVNGVEGSGEHHACNLVRTPQTWLLFEPQNGQYEKLEAVADSLSECNLVIV